MQQTRHFKQPTKIRRSESTVEGLNVDKPDPDFRYINYPESWTFHEAEGGWLPEAKKVVAVRGANGVGESGDLSRLIGGVMAKGGTVIEPSDPRLGEFIDYVAFYETTAGKKHHVFSFATAAQLRSGKVRWNEDVNADWMRFRRCLRDSGIVPPMEHVVYVDKLEVQRERIKRTERRYGDKPNLMHRIETERDKLQSMMDAWDEMTAEDEANAPLQRPTRMKVPTFEDDTTPTPTVETPAEFKCLDCGKVAKTAAGLGSHRKHCKAKPPVQATISRQGDA